MLRANEKKDFILHFDPYNEEHVDMFMYYKQKQCLPMNHDFADPIARYDVVCARISNKIVHSWSDEIEKSTNYRRLKTPRNLGRDELKQRSKPKNRLCLLCDVNTDDENRMCKPPKLCIIL